MTETTDWPYADPVTVVDYDPEWPDIYLREAPIISDALGDMLETIDHVGSTSVPGLAAKPVIDINVGLKSVDDLDAIVPIVKGSGYRYRPEYEDELPFRRLFDKFVDGERRFHVHVVQWESDFRREHIVFRDHLREHPDVARAYGELKRGLALKYRNDRTGYMDGKDGFIEETLGIALAGSAEIMRKDI